MVVDIRAAEQDVTEARKALAKSEAEVKQAEEEVTKVHVGLSTAHQVFNLTRRVRTTMKK